MTAPLASAARWEEGVTIEERAAKAHGEAEASRDDMTGGKGYEEKVAIYADAIRAAVAQAVEEEQGRQQYLLEESARLARETEREECAKIAMNWSKYPILKQSVPPSGWKWADGLGRLFADAIRARSEKEDKP